MTSLLPQIRDHINAADFQTVAAFLPPAGEGRTLAVSANEKAVILRGGRVVDMFSGGAKPVRENDEAIIASLRKYHLIIGFGDCSDSHYNISPTRIHASGPAFRIADGEEIRSMIVAISFALDRNDRTNVEKLMAVNAADADAITVSDLAASLPKLPHLIQILIAGEKFDAPSIKTADPERVAGIERQIMFAADGMLREYGALSDGAALNVIATSRDAELSLPEKDREANADHRLKLANLHREDERLERQVQAMEKRLETERIARQTEMMRTEIMEERLKQSRIQAEIERLDPRMGAASANGEPLSPSQTTYAPPAQSAGNSPTASQESKYWLNETAAGVTLHRGTCVYVRNWAKPPNWRGFSTREIALNFTRRPVLGCKRCSPYLGGDANVPAFTREELAEVNRKGGEGRTRLHRAASMGNTETAQTLMDSGADVTIKDKEGNTPLHLAAARGRTETMQALIVAGANLNAGDKEGLTPLHQAADNGNTETAQALIVAGANVDAEDDHGNTPLHRAASSYGDVTEVAQALIDAGANIDAKNDYGETPLHRAVGNHVMKMAQWLIAAGANVNAVRGRDGSTPLHNMASWGNIEIAQALIAAGADIHAKDKDGRTPLHEVVHRNIYSGSGIVNVLIGAGADVHAADNDGATPLSMVNERTKTLISQALKAASRGYTQLHVAATAGDTKTAKALIADGANVNAKDNVGWTPLRHAARNGRGEMADALIAAGADVNAKDNVGWTPLHHAALNGHGEITKALVNAGANVNAVNNSGDTPLHLAAAGGGTETAQALIAAGANVNAVNDNGDTPLHRAAYTGRMETAQALMAAGANRDAKDSEGNTPLHNAASRGHIETAQALIDAGADIYVKNNGGIPPLNADMQRRDENSKPIVEKRSWLARLFGR